ncbi:unnamed protein product [Caenorhabditis auriculariae]|uniref:Uncharacterized protein n=1 Tax=Caenorhabditis auriculariae TaxID=2777116 RepID=A0A8S1H0Y6_9PELO|nr:unnamed protein product [Caenorhabditis auriculariae]
MAASISRAPFDQNDKKYTSCFGKVHIRKSAKIVAIIVNVLTAINIIFSFTRSSTVIVYTLMSAAFSVVVFGSLLYGVYKEKRLYLFPYLLFQLMSIAITIIILFAFIISIAAGSRMVVDLGRNLGNIDLDVSQETLDSELATFTVLFILFMCIGGLFQAYFLDIIYGFHNFLKDRENSFSFNFESYANNSFSGVVSSDLQVPPSYSAQTSTVQYTSPIKTFGTAESQVLFSALMSNVLVLLAACFLGARAISLTPEKALEEMIKWDASHPPVTGPPSSNLNGNAGSNGNGNANNGSNPNPSFNNPINNTNGNGSAHPRVNSESIKVKKVLLKINTNPIEFLSSGDDFTITQSQVADGILSIELDNVQKQVLNPFVIQNNCFFTLSQNVQIDLNKLEYSLVKTSKTSNSCQVWIKIYRVGSPTTVKLIVK